MPISFSFISRQLFYSRHHLGNYKVVVSAGITYTMQSFMGPLSAPVFDRHSIGADNVHMMTSNSTSLLCSLVTGSHCNVNDSTTGDVSSSHGAATARRYSVDNPKPDAVTLPAAHHPDGHGCHGYASQLIRHPQHKLQYCIIYLAPGDYHRFHSPADWRVGGRRHFSGKLLCN